MFGLTFEKLIIVGVIAAFVIGPERLPLYASKLAAFVKQIRGFTNDAKSRMKEEMGPDFDEVEWKKLDPRQYDPRRIIRDALLEDPAEAAPSPVKPSAPMAASALAPAVSAAPPAPEGDAVPVTLTRPEPAYLQRKKKLEAAAAANGTDGVAMPLSPYDSEAT
ncbi:Sec-independent protein translocase family protein [Subtercola endophyticus]|uniref:Sec-independent protein translocase TatB n=1 Tax=Subtercola endophyticus TaxID=2895559 RepID=UPI001E2AE4F4|nr:Sec-independent protein translocase TatB [Subtercola endophyticus]UFS59912.1 Sec-independent protein translocase TatB [Subtercola endophyticus]